LTGLGEWQKHPAPGLQLTYLAGTGKHPKPPCVNATTPMQSLNP